MERKAQIIQSSEDGKRKIAVDEENGESIFEFLEEKKLAKKFAMICELLIRGIKNTDLYGREEIDTYSKGVTAIKFKGRQNTRIYCKELTTEDEVLIVIVSELHKKKKNQKNKSPEKSLIHKVASYEYKIE